MLDMTTAWTLSAALVNVRAAAFRALRLIGLT
jgi:hypothetical protein